MNNRREWSAPAGFCTGKASPASIALCIATVLHSFALLMLLGCMIIPIHAVWV